MKLSIIILNFNTLGLLKQTLASIRPKLTHEIIVVDNGSTDGSVDYLSQLKDVKSICLGSNQGFARGNNTGLKHVTGDYLLLLNSDTQVIANSIEKSVKYLDRHPQVGILTPKLMLSDGAIDLACHRGFPTPLNSLAYFLQLERLFPNQKLTAGYHQTWQDFDTVHSIDAVSGASMFIRRKVITDIGYLDERFFMYAEDIDFCRRAKTAGWQVIYYPKAVIVHFKGSSGTNSQDLALQQQTRAHFYQTMKQYFDKHFPHYPKPLRQLIHLSIDVVRQVKK